MLIEQPSYTSIAKHSAMKDVFRSNRLTLGILFPIESYQGDLPQMTGQEALAQRAEKLGFSALWFRDVPLRVPSFGDAGQVYDPFVYMSWIAAHTKTIKLGTAATILPLRHPLHTAKMAASIDQLSNGRVLLGVASGDRAQEYPAFGKDAETRGGAFRDSFEIIQSVLRNQFPTYNSEHFGNLAGQGDILPKPAQANMPMIAVGSSQQPLEWIAKHADAWLMYPRPLQIQQQIVAAWVGQLQSADRSGTPFGQSLYIDLAEHPSEPPRPIHLGFRSGRNHLVEHLHALAQIGVSHVILNLKYAGRPAGEIVEEVGEFVIPQLSQFQSNTYETSNERILP